MRRKLGEAPLRYLIARDGSRARRRLLSGVLGVVLVALFAAAFGVATTLGARGPRLPWPHGTSAQPTTTTTSTTTTSTSTTPTSTKPKPGKPDPRNQPSTRPRVAAALGTDAAVIDNGTVMLGVNDAGDLNCCSGSNGGPDGSGTTIVGLRYDPTGFESTADGCTCEGWGVADAGTGTWGGANTAVGGNSNIEGVSFTSTSTTAVSVVDVLDESSTPVMRVTHDYHPSVTPNLYEVTVSVKNLSTTATISDLRYRRAMDWDIQPTPTDEFVTIHTGGAANVLSSSDDGFAGSNPLISPVPILFSGEATHSGPADHGAVFDFGFGPTRSGSNTNLQHLLRRARDRVRRARRFGRRRCRGLFVGAGECGRVS